MSRGVAMPVLRAARRGVILAAIGAAGAIALAACKSGTLPEPVSLPGARPPTAAEEVARWSGAFLSGDEAASRDAEDALLSLDAAHREALREQAARARSERDPRWLLVLDENGVLGEATDAERTEILLVKAAHRSPGVAARGADALLALAREKPDVLVERLKGPGPGREALAVALAKAEASSAVPALAALYRSPATPAERRGAAFALARLVPSAPAPRPDGDAQEREEDATIVIEAWTAARSGHEGGGDRAPR